MVERVFLAANNPDLGGGEQMLVRTAAALVSLGRPVTVVAPDIPPEVLDAAAHVGADVIAIRADGRRDYLHRLRAWDRAERHGLLWCHGLVPSLATAGHARRLVHLHQQPRSHTQQAAAVLARAGSERTFTPSSYLSSRIRHASVCANWTDDIVQLPPPLEIQRIGFLGRLSTDKGLDLLARAVSTLPRASSARLVVAGDDRWVPAAQRTPVIDALATLGGRVEPLGRITAAEFFSSVDLAVFPSRVPESFGLVVAEAMAAGIPFVISDAGALPEVAGPEHPWVARAGNADDLARVIGRALDATPEAVRVVTDRARVRWDEEYSPQAGRLRVQRLLDELAPA